MESSLPTRARRPGWPRRSVFCGTSRTLRLRLRSEAIGHSEYLSTLFSRLTSPPPGSSAPRAMASGHGRCAGLTHRSGATLFPSTGALSRPSFAFEALMEPFGNSRPRSWRRISFPPVRRHPRCMRSSRSQSFKASRRSDVTDSTRLSRRRPKTQVAPAKRRRWIR